MRTHDTSGTILFQEIEKFPAWLNWILILPVMIMVGLFVMLMAGNQIDKQEMIIAICAVLPVNIGMFWLFRFVKLEKVVTSNGLYYRYQPLQRKYRYIAFDEMETYEIGKGPSLKYGSSYYLRYGWVHKMNDGEGVQLYLKNGKKMFFGTSELFSFRKALDQFRERR